VSPKTPSHPGLRFCAVLSDGDAEQLGSVKASAAVEAGDLLAPHYPIFTYSSLLALTFVERTFGTTAPAKNIEPSQEASVSGSR
jgi:hypothetical protein